MIELVQPRCFMPVHGTLHHLRRHADLARQCGVEERIVVENGSSVVFDGQRLTAGERFASGVVRVGMGGKPLSDATLKQRAEMARSGVATLTLALDSDDRVVAGPELSFRGVPGAESAPGAVKSVLRDVARHVESVRRRAPRDVLVEDLRRVVRRGLEPIAGTRPVVEVVVSRCRD
jgi:ribonuclease J